MSLEFKIDIVRAKEVAYTVIDMMQRRVYPFDVDGRFPDADIPKCCNPAQWSFYSGFLDYRTDSHQMYRELRVLASQPHGLQMLADDNSYRLSRVFVEYFPKSIGSSHDNKRRRELSDAILFNNEKMQREYGGDPRNIKTEDVEETQKRITEFKLYGIQKAALFTKNMVRFGMWDFSPYEIPVKMDRHAARIMVGTGVVRFYEDGEEVDYFQLNHRLPTDKVRKELRKEFYNVTGPEKISAIDLNDGIWLIGNMGCKRNNSTYCRINCDLNCFARPHTDGQGSTHILGSEHRKNAHQQVLDFD